MVAELGHVVLVSLLQDLAAVLPHSGAQVFPHGLAVLGPENGSQDARDQGEEEEEVEEELGRDEGEEHVQEGQDDGDDGEDENEEEDLGVGEAHVEGGVVGQPPLDVLVVHHHPEGEAEGAEGGQEEHGHVQVVLLDGHGEGVEGQDDHAESDDQREGAEHDELVLLLLPLGVEVLAPLAAPVVRVGLHLAHVGLVEGHVHEHRHARHQEEDHEQNGGDPHDQLGEGRGVVLGVHRPLPVVVEAPEGQVGEHEEGHRRDDREGQQPVVLPVVEEHPGHHGAN